MKALTVVFVVLLVASTASVPALAAGIEAGSVELETNTGFSYVSYSPKVGSDVKYTQLRVGGTVGYFFTSLFELHVGMLVDYTNVDPGPQDSYSTTDAGMGVLFAANFATQSAVVPFVGAGASIISHSGDVGDADKLTFNAPRVVAGVRFLTGNSASINVGVSYEYEKNAFGVEDVTGNLVMLEVGVSAFVKGGRTD